MSLIAILDAVEARLTAQLAAAGEPEVTYLFGAEHIADHGNPPRIVWEPTQDPITPAMNQDGRQKQVWTRNVGVRAHIWSQDPDGGDGYTETETLLHQFLFALWFVTHGSVTPGAASWDPMAKETLKLGRVVILPFSIEIPVVSTGATLTVPATETVTVELDNP